MSEIVPFGKYKGKPVDAMMQDRPYVEWLMGQNWFQTSNLYTIVINNFGESSETPEHNAMQALFLDDEFNKNYILKVLEPEAEKEYERVFLWYEYEINALKEKVSKHSAEDLRYYQARADKEKLESYIKDFKEHNNKKTNIEFYVRFEEQDIDVKFGGRIKKGISCYDFRSRIELKPQVGDDYPSVLRGMNRKECDILILKQYTGTGATRDQFVKIFMASRIKVIFLDELK